MRRGPERQGPALPLPASPGAWEGLVRGGWTPPEGVPPPAPCPSHVGVLTSRAASSACFPAGGLRSGPGTGGVGRRGTIPGTPGSPARAQLPTGRGASSWRGLPRVFAAAEYMACPGPGGRPCSNLMIRVGRASAGRFRDRQVTSGHAAAGMRAMGIGLSSAPATERLGEGDARTRCEWPWLPARWQARSGTGVRAGGGGPVCRSGETGAPLDCGTGPRWVKFRQTTGNRPFLVV